VRLSGVHGFVAATWRLALGALITLILAALSGSIRELSKANARDLALMALAGAALAAHFGLWMQSLYHLNVAPSVTIVDSYPALMAVVGWKLYGEKPGIAKMLGATIAILGVAGLAWTSNAGNLAPPGGDPALGVTLAFAGMLGVAVYFIVGKSLRSKYSTLAYTLPVYTIAAVLEAVASKIIGEPLTGYTLETYAYLTLLALLPMLGGHTLINYLLGRISLLAATIPVLGEPVGASILAWLILGEHVSPTEAILMTVTISGIALVLWEESKSHTGPEK